MTAEQTRGTADEVLRRFLRAARELGLTVEEISRESGLPAEEVYGYIGEPPPFQPRRSHA